MKFEIDITLKEDGQVLALLNRILNAVQHSETRIMATLNEFIALQTTYQTQLDESLTAIGDDIQTLKDQIQVLTDAAGSLTPVQQAALDALSVTGTALAAKAQALNDLTPPVAPPVV